MTLGFVDIGDVVVAAFGDIEGREPRLAASRAAFDAISCTRAGARTARPEWTGTDSGEVTMIGAGRRASLLDAIGHNAAACHALDRDDLHWPSAVHAGGVVWPVAFAIGEQLDADVGTVLDAGAIGYQIAARMSLLLGPDHRRFFHATSTCGSIAAAAVGAQLHGGGSEAVTRAVRSAASVVGGTRQALAELSDTAIAHRSHAAVSGVIAGRFAGQRPVGEPLGGPLGLCAATGTTPDWATVEEPLVAVIGDVTVRSHPVSGFAHTMVDALLALPEVDPEQIRIVRVRLPAALAGSDSAKATSARTAAWNLRLVAALAVAGRLTISPLSWPIDSQIKALAERVEITTDPSYVAGVLTAAVTVETLDGEVCSTTCDVPHGHPEDPLTDAELVTRSVELGAFNDNRTARAVLESLQRNDKSLAEVLGEVADPIRPE